MEQLDDEMNAIGTDDDIENMKEPIFPLNRETGSLKTLKHEKGVKKFLKNSTRNIIVFIFSKFRNLREKLSILMRNN